MKKYREVCHFVDDLWQPIGYALFDTETQCYKYVKRKQLNSLVQKGLVQYFVWDNISKSIAIMPIGEEKESFDKKLENSGVCTVEDYLYNDLKAPSYFYDYLTRSSEFILAMCHSPRRVPVVGTIITVQLIGARNTIGRFCLNLDNDTRKLVKVTETGIHMTYPVKFLTRLNENMLYTDVLFGTEALKRKELFPGVVDTKAETKKVKSDDLLNGDIVDFVEFFDSITEQTLLRNKHILRINESTERLDSMNLF